MRILLLPLLLLSVSSGAEAREFIPVRNESHPLLLPSPKTFQRIDLITADECFAILRPVALPLDIVKEGLNALVDPSITAKGNLACLNEVVSNWQRYAPPEVPLPPPPLKKKIEAPEVDHSLQKSLREKLKCFVNFTADFDFDEPAESDLKKKQACEGKTMSAEEKADLQAKLAKEDLRVEVLEGLAMKSNPTAQLQSLWLATANAEIKLPDGRTRADLKKCFNGEEPGSDAHAAKQATALAACGGKLLSKEEMKKASDELNKLFMPTQAKLRLFKNYLDDLQVLNPKANVFERGKRLGCFSPYDAGSEGGKLYESAAAANCEGFGVRPSADEMAYRKGLIPDLRKLQPDFEKWLGKRLAAAKERSDEYDRLNPDRYRNYGMRRLFARYKSHLGKDGDPAQLLPFCKAYEEDQRRDLRYAEAGLTLSIFEEERDWAAAKELGLTEAEYSAIKAYTGSFFNEINPALWKAQSGQPLDKRMATYQATMLKAMERVPPYRGAVRRFSALPPEVLAEHAVGNIVNYAAYTSTSAKPDWAWNGSDEKVTHSFLIYGATGKQVVKLSDLEKEQEVLFPPNTRFKVLSRREQAGKPGAFDFVMAEVDAAGNVIAELPTTGTEPGK